MVTNKAGVLGIVKPSLTVFFDGSCPICSKEIDFYKGREGAGHLNWIDVSDEGNSLPVGERSRQELMARFHVMQDDGTLLSGGAAFAELWASLPVFSIPGRLFKLPILRLFINIGYDIFLKARPMMQRFFLKS